MDSVFQELKRAREARHLSISDVSDVTLINIRFLEAIEEGHTDILPQTYVRAFIREYANCVGLDPADIMKRYDTVGAPAAPPAPEPAHPQQTIVEQAKPEPVKPSESGQKNTSRYLLPALVVVIATIIIWNLNRPSPQESLRENTIDSGTIAAPRETTKVLVPAATPVALTDSLTLSASVSESVWVQIIVDDRSPQQFLFRPGRKVAWRARDRFRLSTGNAGALDLTLNEKKIGVPGKRGAILRSVEYNRQTLQQK